MAVIGRIQKNSVLLLIVIGGAMLAFIFTDMFKSSGNDQEILATGTVYGESIDEDEYSELRDVYINREKQSAAQQQQEWTKQREISAEDQAFNETVRRNLMDREFEKLGLVCTSAELNDMLMGNHIHPWVQQVPMFNSLDGSFSRDSVSNFINNLEIEPEAEEQREQWLEGRRQWSAFEKELKDTRVADKYVSLVKKGLFVNSLEAESAYLAKNEVRTVRFAVQKYSDIAFDEIELTDEDLKAYFEEHKDEKQYEMDETRVVDFVSIPIVPTAEDYNDLKLEMESIAQKFSKAENNLAFMNVHSSVQAGNDSIEFGAGTEELTLPRNQFQPTGSYPLVADDAIQSAQVGDVIGPFAAIESNSGQNVMFVAKVTDLRKENQSWVRHILVNIDATRSEEEAKLKAEEIIADIEANDNFVDNVVNNSDDPGSIATNGEYKWFPEGRMVPEFNDASFNGEIGKLQLVKTQFGFHIVEVLGRGERNVPKLAIVTKRVKPSENTLKYSEEQAYQFIYDINDSKADSAFYTISADSGFTVMNSRIWINQTYVTGMKNYEKMMRFAFSRNALEGDISDPMLDGDNYVVAYLVNVIEEGAPEFEDVKEQMRFSALKDKQAKVYMEKMAGKKSLAEVAALTKGGNILNAQLSFGANVIAGGGGNEPEVIGSVFRKEFKVGAMTVPLQGRSGVYVLILDGITEAPEVADYTVEKEYSQTARRGAADNLVIRSLREKADVKDNRRKREYQ